jgi:putative flippase GtrA
MRFGLVGVAATATDFTVFNLGLLLAAPSSRVAVIALNTLAFAMATFISYQLNTRFTFASARGRQALLRRRRLQRRAAGGALRHPRA